MNLFDKVSLIEGKTFTEGFKIDEIATAEQLEEFLDLLSIDQRFSALMLKTESAEEFFEACRLLEQMIPDTSMQRELFYAAKVGQVFEGVPSKLVFYLKKAIMETESPNRAIEAMNPNVLSKYCVKGALPEGITIKKLMVSLIGSEFKTLVSFRRKVKYKDFYEIYVESSDRVLLLPEDIAEHVDSRVDLMALEYKKDIGVCINDLPLRTMAGHIGITSTDYDLRKVR